MKIKQANLANDMSFAAKISMQQLQSEMKDQKDKLAKLNQKQQAENAKASKIQKSESQPEIKKLFNQDFTTQKMKMYRYPSFEEKPNTDSPQTYSDKASIN